MQAAATTCAFVLVLHRAGRLPLLLRRLLEFLLLWRRQQ
jgi:hypothetical protein